MYLKQYKSNADVILSHYGTDAYSCLLNKSDIKKLHEKILFCQNCASALVRHEVI